MNRNKLLIAITCALTVSLAFSAAAYSGGNGTEETPYIISTADDLKELAEASKNNSFDGVYFKQSADIIIDGAFTSIATDESKPFMGSYNGMDYDITGAELSSGMFVHVKDAAISNIELRNAVLNVSAVSGGIAANVLGETVIESCYFDGNAVFPASLSLGYNVGGIAGNIGENASVKECTSIFEMTSEHSPLVLYAGSIAGYNKGMISECLSISDIEAVSDNYLISFGGIAGENQGEIYGCEANGSISGQIANDVALFYIGGIAGHNNGGKIERALNKANLYVAGCNDYPGYIGGIAGYNQNGNILVSGNNGSVGGSINYAGGVTGINYASDGTSTVNECLNVGKITVSTGIIGGIVGGNLATDKLENVSTVSSSMNLYELTSGKGAVGIMQNDFIGVTVAKDLVVRNITDVYATTMTDSQLVSSQGLAQLTSDAWVYPRNGFLPSLAVVKNLAKAEAIATAVDSENSKVAFTVYNPGEDVNAVAVVSFFKGSRFTGAKLVDIKASNGYSVHTAPTDLAKDADSAKIMVVNTVTDFAPITRSGSY